MGTGNYVISEKTPSESLLVHKLIAMILIANHVYVISFPTCNLLISNLSSNVNPEFKIIKVMRL